MACLIIFKRAYIMLHVAHFIGSSCAWCWQCSWLCLIIFVVCRCGSPCSPCGLPVIFHIIASSRVFSFCFICHLFLSIICDCFRSGRAHETFWCWTIIGKEGMPKSNLTSWSSYLAFFLSWFHHICNHLWIELSAPVSSSLCPLDVTHWQDMAVVTRNELCPQVGSQENGPRQMPWGSEPWQIQIGGKNVCWALPCLATLCCRVEVESCFFSSSIPQNLTWWVDGEDAYPKRLPRVLVQLTRLAFNAFLNRRNRLQVSEQSKTMSECERCSVELVHGLVPQAKVPDYRFRGRWVTQHSGPLFFGWWGGGGGVCFSMFFPTLTCVFCF